MPGSRNRGDDTAADSGGAARSKPSASEVRSALERILASRCFQQAGRASDFLRFVVERTLAGEGQRLKGYTIGVEVFGRPADFDAQSDALVRVEAGRLRRRLVEYYASDGVEDPVRIELPRGTYAIDYRFAGPGEDAQPVAAAAPSVADAPRTPPWRGAAIGLALLLVACVGVIAWQRAQLNAPGRPLAAQSEPQRTEWPRIVVVPFENLSAEPGLDALAAMMTEEIMLRLDDLDLFVIATQSSWYGPGKRSSFDAAAPGGYVLTGSVRGAGEQARITARLIEAETGAQLWTAAYDEPLTGHGLADLQERVARDVVAVAAPYGPIFEAELLRARRTPDSPKLRDCYATYHEYRRRVTPAGYQETLACLQRVSERQPDFAPVWSGLAVLVVDEFASSFGRTGPAALQSAREAAEKALALDRDDFLANLALMRVQFFEGDPAYGQSIERTIGLRPNSSQALASAGFLFVIAGDSAAGLELTEKARALTKTPLGFYYLTLAASHLRERRFDDAFVAAARVDGAANWVFAQALLAAAAAHAGHDDVAHGAAQRIRELYPEFEAEALRNFEYWHFDPELFDALVGGLRAAGLVLELPHTAAATR
jgi:adenylate cyclase